MDEEISRFMLLAARLEFFLVNLTHEFAHVDSETRVVRGVNWDQVGQSLEGIRPFEDFDFSKSGFQIFKDTIPQRLVAKNGGGLKWDSDEIKVSSWQVLLGRSYAQVRNNVAHGNKAQLSAPFTHDRTKDLLEAGHHLIHFIAGEYSSDESWSNAIQFS
ncbi:MULTISPECIES: hypothetical protein [Phaeobacter]|uniref:Uncharacterized protein n=1 Tax=Phaeobacter inhibens TaxID=221822 RepID=A0A2I7K4V9_9RHOB|nr:hypothetical protein [Phaeobacter inhibens]AUQ97647.1 hypothetical protein PhaeoP88_00243 [Phaeobacter inhibens]